MQEIHDLSRAETDAVEATGNAGTNGRYRGETILNTPVLPYRWHRELLILPEQAEMILHAMPAQRSVYEGEIRNYTNMILNDDFGFSHGIMFNTKGELIDGQHRMHACVRAGKPIRILVTFNAPDDTYRRVDRNKRRRVGDDLSQEGVCDRSHANIFEASAKILFHWEAGRLPWAQMPRAYSSDAVAVVERHPKLVDSVAWTVGHRSSANKIPASPFAAFLTLFREADEARALEFAEQVATGIGYYSEKEPAHLLRASLVRGGTTKTGQARNAFMVRFVRAWNAFRVNKLQKTLSGVIVEGSPFPHIDGLKRPASGEVS